MVASPVLEGLNLSFIIKVGESCAFVSGGESSDKNSEG